MHRRRKRRIALLLGVLALIPASSATAKCSFIEYVVEGEVDLPAGSHKEVKLYLFLEGMESTSAYTKEAGTADYVHPGPDGHFEVESWFNRLSGYTWLRGERCNKVALYGDLFIVAEGLEAKRVRVHFGESRRALRGKTEIRAQLGSISLKQLP